MCRMDRLSNCIELLHSRWLASSISCCFPRLPVQSEPEPPGVCLIFRDAGTLADFVQLLIRRGMYATSSPSHSLLPLLIINVYRPNRKVFTVRRNGSSKVATLLHGLRAGEASLQGERQIIDLLSEHLLISEKLNTRTNGMKGFALWSLAYTALGMNYLRYQSLAKNPRKMSKGCKSLRKSGTRRDPNPCHRDPPCPFRFPENHWVQRGVFPWTHHKTVAMVETSVSRLEHGPSIADQAS